MKRIVTLILFVLMMAVGISHAQQPTGRLTGCVTDPEGTRIIGATIRILNTNQGGIAKAPNGQYLIANIRPGEYEVTISVIGYKPVKRYVVIVPDETTALDVQFEERAMPSEPGCFGRRVISPERVGTVYTITSQDLERMP
jgi:hypothetical protein